MGTDLYTAGRDARPVATQAGRLGMLLCSEAMLPRYAAELSRAGAELLVNPSNDGWFADLGAARQQLAAVALRAIENRRSVLRPTATGYTAVIDPHGRVVAEAPPGVPAVLEAEVAGSRAATPYQAWGDAVVLGPGAAALASTFIPLLRRTRRTQETPACSPEPRLV
jgi:apolipoprotein N-acyltransferase